MLRTLLFSEAKDTGLLIFRILFGIIMVIHGVQKFGGGEQTLVWVGSALKMFGITGGYYFFGIMAAVSETIGGILIGLGLLTRLGSLLVIGALSVASIIMSGADFNTFSHPLTVLSVGIMFFFTGAGKYSLDYAWLKK